MTRLIGAVMAVAMLVSVATVLAGDTFHALSRLPTTAQASLTPMDEAQLAAIEGAQVGVMQSNTSIVNVTQSNSITGSGAGPVVQQNYSYVRVTQQNSANVR
jgi:hypothetical protein